MTTITTHLQTIILKWTRLITTCLSLVQIKANSLLQIGRATVHILRKRVVVTRVKFISATDNCLYILLYTLQI